MATWGDKLPDALRKAAIDRILSAGSVVKVTANFTNPPKLKRFVILCEQPEVLAFVINSEIGPFIKNRPHLLRCQVTITKAEYDFLDHDSYINCGEVITEKNIGDIRDKLDADIDAEFHGRLNQDTIDQIIAATKYAAAIIPAHKKAIIDALNALSEQT